MDWKYWRVVCRYGHVGVRREVSVARFLVTEASHNPIMVMDLVSEMPGVKYRGIVSITQITQEEYLIGKRQELENLYLQKLMNSNPETA
ncbi:hypothetical protein [Bacillus wiedmannii]|uniref:hypothetical protein n=1 Tax=Bacillus wiedmannii TaxID=1890302 RepID=UPI000BFE7E39|nr:hypothetical protein [Bacillus wiedmannii]PHG81181.1 hypothetical protein COI50_01145 [Bacillus wiedmannii]